MTWYFSVTEILEGIFCEIGDLELFVALEGRLGRRRSIIITKQRAQCAPRVCP